MNTRTLRARRTISALVFAAGAALLLGPRPADAAITVDTNAWYVLVNANSGKALDLYNWITADGAEFRQWTRGDGANQQFQFVSSGNGYYRLRNRHSGKVVGVANGSTANGGAINQYTDQNAASQQFRLAGSDNNAVRFVNANSGKALDVVGASTADGADIQQYTDVAGRNQTWALVPVTTTTPPPPTGGVRLPTSFRWTSSAALMVAKPAAQHPEVAIKDPTVVYHGGRWHVFSTQAKGNGWGLEYRSFTDWANAGSANPYFLDSTRIGAGYRAAPFIFFHTPSQLWYLVFQNGNAAYSTNPDINNPGGWSAVRTFYSSVPSNIQADIRAGANWLDFAVACDTVNCHLFSAGDNGKIYRSQTTLANFPNGFGSTVVTLQDSNRNNLFEAPQVYKVRETGQYLMIIEAIGSSGRYFRSFTSSSLSGPWTAMASATESNPFAGDANVSFPTGKWSQGISHGEILRTGYDQNLEISACNMRFLYQGLAPGASGSYDRLPYRLGLLTQTNSPC
ncbi:RICIN domain-containing protein [Rhizobacter sp. J219]|uniref:non-reducing end alpha-L-arabinofuranosidase family hydrolase n=1 Tax=Rhizobacter sp. J219 TaxID=2898430 RepID=UPI002150D60C|nr:non-reducing end alpha-L-arabinofuranosidase family hydrolase [Rhizobacter sp. J219]MCR5884952.1 RICIN domain-containing protein [Rhizobacter sp. J219]